MGAPASGWQRKGKSTSSGLGHEDSASSGVTSETTGIPTLAPRGTGKGRSGGMG